jgi:hypothetical protein
MDYFFFSLLVSWLFLAPSLKIGDFYSQGHQKGKEIEKNPEKN